MAFTHTQPLPNHLPSNFDFTSQGCYLFRVVIQPLESVMRVIDALLFDFCGYLSV